METENTCREWKRKCVRMSEREGGGDEKHTIFLCYKEKKRMYKNAVRP